MFRQSRKHWICIFVATITLLTTVTADDHIQCKTWCNSQPTVQATDGCLCGTKMDGLEAGPFDAFLGVPYAKPPVGSLRFANPVPIGLWNGPLNASTIKPMCIQKYDIFPDAIVRGQEDCLFLNIYRPKLNCRKRLPVMVYIHGGAFIGSSANPLLIGPEKLMYSRKVILVAVQYRLGVLGFLSTDDQWAPGNFGLKDQALALRWVQRNIARFGGDPRRVTIFGNSAGAASAQFHMMSPLSKGLFSKAILQSGSALAFWSKAYPDQLGLVRKLSSAAGIASSDRLSSRDLISTLREMDASKLVNSIDKLKFWRKQPIVLFRPVVEKYVNEETFLADDPRDLWATGRYQKVPWMTGFVPDEGIVLLISILSNSTLLREFIENQQELLPHLVDLPGSVGPSLIEKFFNGQLISPMNAINLTKIMSERAFLYPMMESVLYHLINDPKGKAPLSMYYFNFKGRYSCSVLTPLLANADNSGTCHAEELMYLFRQQMNYMDFPKDSPEAGMSRLLVSEWINFAYKGELTLTGEDSYEGSPDRIGMVEFTNSVDSSGIAAIYRNFNNPTITALWEMLRRWNIILNQAPTLSLD